MKIYKIASEIYYHGSYDNLEIGTILTPEMGNFVKTLSPLTMDSHFKLEMFKPPSFLSRNNGVYMCKDIDDIDLSGGSSDHIYVVEPLGKVEAHDLNWMSEIEVIMDRAHENGTVESEKTIEEVRSAALNYWNGIPHFNESVWEYTTPSAKVIKEV